jgi:hypothetical protein
LGTPELGRLQRVQQGNLVPQTDQVLHQCEVIMAGRFQPDHHLVGLDRQPLQEAAEVIESNPIYGKADLGHNPLRCRSYAAAWCRAFPVSTPTVT